MEWIFRAIILCLTAALFAAVLERTEPTIALLLCILATVLVVLLSGTVLEPILHFLEELNCACGLSGIYTKPLIKCLSVSLMTRLGSALCRDAKHTGSAAALEFLGSAAAVWTCLPLMEAFLSMLQGLL